MAFIPAWDFRRNFARNFNYEFRFGIGLGVYLGKMSQIEQQVLLLLALRLATIF